MIGPKKLYLNGEYVGEVPAAKDEAEHEQLARAMLKATGRYRPVSRLQAMFNQAHSFATTSSYLFNRDLQTVPRNGATVAPFVVNSAFAIELYLKTLGQMHGVSLRGHDLLKLFDGLPTAVRDELVSLFPTANIQCGIASVPDFRAAIEGMRSAFIEWRYMFEKAETDSIQIQSLIFVMEVLHNACRKHIDAARTREVQEKPVAGG